MEVSYNFTWKDNQITKLTTNFHPEYPGNGARPNQKPQGR